MLSEIARTIAIVVSLVVSCVPVGVFLISIWSKKQKEIEHLKTVNTKSALNRLDEEVRDFKLTVTSMQETLRETKADMLQTRSDVKLLNSRLDDTQKLIDRYEKAHTTTIKNMIKTEITELTKEIWRIRNKKTP